MSARKVYQHPECKEASRKQTSRKSGTATTRIGRSVSELAFRTVKAEEIIGAEVEAIREHGDPAYRGGYYSLIILNKKGIHYSVAAKIIAEGDSVGLEIGTDASLVGVREWQLLK